MISLDQRPAGVSGQAEDRHGHGDPTSEALIDGVNPWLYVASVSADVEGCLPVTARRGSREVRAAPDGVAAERHEETAGTMNRLV